ncbi:MAG: hypothetical protein Kow00129_12060 [Thermoleophilia bacterium]
MIFVAGVAVSLFFVIVFLPIWPYSRSWGWFPASTIMLIPMLFFFLWVFNLI